MDKPKSLLHHLGEALDAYRTERRTEPEGAVPRPHHLRRFLRWMIPNGGTILLVLVLILTQRVWARPLQQQVNVPGPSATTVNYQGRLADAAGNPLDGTYGMSFSLWDAPSGGTVVWGPESHPAVPVSGGLFSVGLGSQTSGGIPTTVWDGDRYLEITVGGETMTPRELIRSVPIAGMALTVPDGAIGTAQIADGAVTSEKLAPTIAANYDEADVTTASSTYVLLQQVSVSLDAPGQLLVTWQSTVRNDADMGGGNFRIRLDGAYIDALRASYTAKVDMLQQIIIVGVVEDVGPGTHTVEVYWQTRNGGTLTSFSRQLSVIVLGQ